MSTGCCSTELRQVDERLELLRRGRVLADSVVAQAEQLAHRRGVRDTRRATDGAGARRRAHDRRRTPRRRGRAGLARGGRRGPPRRASSSAPDVRTRAPAAGGLGARLLRPTFAGLRACRCGPCGAMRAGLVGARRASSAGRRNLRLGIVGAAPRRVAVVGVLRRALVTASCRRRRLRSACGRSPPRLGSVVRCGAAPARRRRRLWACALRPAFAARAWPSLTDAAAPFGRGARTRLPDARTRAGTSRSGLAGISCMHAFETRERPPRAGGRSLRKNPAATYSPRGSTPKYHRRGRA